MIKKLKYFLIFSILISTSVFAVLPLFGWAVAEAGILTAVRAAATRIGINAATDPRVQITAGEIFKKLAGPAAAGLVLGTDAYLSDGYKEQGVIAGLLTFSNGEHLSWASNGLLSYSSPSTGPAENPPASGIENFCLALAGSSYCSTSLSGSEFWKNVADANPNKPVYECHPDPSYGCPVRLTEPLPYVGCDSSGCTLYIAVGYITTDNQIYHSFNETYPISQGSIPSGQTCQNTKDGDCFSFPSPERTFVDKRPDELKLLLSPAQLAQIIPSTFLADAIDKFWQDASAIPGYRGLPYSFANPVTAADLADAQPLKVSDLLSGSPVIDVAGSGPTVAQSAQTDGVIQQKPDVDAQKLDLGADPGIGEPTGITPTIESILAPFFDLLPDYKNANFQDGHGECTPLEFNALGLFKTTTVHCDLFEQIKPMIFLIMSLVWLFVAIRIVLEA